MYLGSTPTPGPPAGYALTVRCVSFTATAGSAGAAGEKRGAGAATPHGGDGQEGGAGAWRLALPASPGAPASVMASERGREAPKARVGRRPQPPHRQCRPQHAEVPRCGAARPRPRWGRWTRRAEGAKAAARLREGREGGGSSAVAWRSRVTPPAASVGSCRQTLKLPCRQFSSLADHLVSSVAAWGLGSK